MIAAQRLHNLQQHFETSLFKEGKSEIARRLGIFLDGKNRQYRYKVFRMLSEPMFKRNFHASMNEKRRLLQKRYRRIIDEDLLFVHGKPYDAEKFEQFYEAIQLYDNEISSLIGVQYYLFSEGIRVLGTEFHHENFLIPAQTFKLVGCFALTELGHGSNAKDVETTATYDKTSQEFIINTPTITAQKYWIGLASESAEMAIVWAQLYIDQVHYGLHAFLVPLRNKDRLISENVRLRDNGHKMGLNGIDNGRILFTKKRIPREYLLNRYGNVTPEGKYESKFSNVEARFAAQMVNLSRGRVNLATHSTNISKVGLATAVRYALSRRQFGKLGKLETVIMDYPTHKLKLMPLVATTYVHHVAAKALRARYPINALQSELSSEMRKENHILSAGMKAVLSWHHVQTLQTCREACGGQGYKSSNLIGFLKTECDVQVTYEGDNTVLLLSISRNIFELYRKLKNRKINTNYEDSSLLCNMSWQLDIFEDRFYAAGDALEKKINLLIEQSGQSFDDIWPKSQSYAFDLSKTYTELRILQEFAKEEIACGDDIIIPFLSKLRSLHCLHKLNFDPLFSHYLTISSEMRFAIQEQILKLCDELSSIALDLVDAFDIPSFLLGTIAGDWISANDFDNLVSTEHL